MILPVDEVIPDIRLTLANHANMMLVAPPGAGKTTRVPLALLDEPWCVGKSIIMLEPRRLAARTAARQMARQLGEQVGETVGYQVRMDSKVSAKTRIFVVTQGVFTNRILRDPELSDVALVIFDEFHERSLDNDLGLALALDGQGALCEDLRLLVMSATLDANAISGTLEKAPIVRSEGRAFPVETRHHLLSPNGRKEDEIARLIRDLITDEDGSVLVFLPGQSEIRRLSRALSSRLPASVLVAPLYGALPQKEQDKAIQPPPSGMRKIVLSTPIAESSLTIEDVRIVVDTGLARKPVTDPATGMVRLVTRSISQASADQRRGRAGRMSAGLCIRLWHEGQTKAMPPFDEPDILTTDLAGLVLALADWGAHDPSDLKWIDPPSAPRWQEARALLKRLGALDDRGHITTHGRALTRLPLHPRLAHMVESGKSMGKTHFALTIAILLSEGAGGSSLDLSERILNLERDGSPQARAVKNLVKNLARQISGRSAKTDKDMIRTDTHMTGTDRDTDRNRSTEEVGILTSLAFPERIAKQTRQGEDMARYLMAHGRGAEISAQSSFALGPYIVVIDATARGASDLVRCAAAINEEDIIAFHGADIAEKEESSLDLKSGQITTITRRTLGAITLSQSKQQGAGGDVFPKALCNEVMRQGLKILKFDKNLERFLARLRFLHFHDNSWPDFGEKPLQNNVLEWLLPYLAGVSNLNAVTPELLHNALLGRLPYERQREVNRLAPKVFQTPKGHDISIDYANSEAPKISVRPQALYGLHVHPHVYDNRVPLTIEFLSPAQRPIQITKDIKGFWQGSWADVRKDMKSRYPKHDWPENP